MKIDDNRVTFYLRHREQLEEWLALRDDAATAIDQWLAGLRPDIEALALQLTSQEESEIEVVAAVEDTKWPSFYLKRPTWPARTAEEVPPLIGMQWLRGKTLLGASTSPYLGVRSGRESPVRKVLCDNKDFLTSREQRGDKANLFWPAWAYVPPQKPVPEHADAYRELLLETIRGAWKAYAPAVDAAFAQVPEV